MSTTEKSSNANKYAVPILAVLAVLLLGGVIYLAIQNNKLSEQVNMQSEELDEAEQLQQELQREYDNAISELDELKGENEELNALIEQQKSDLEQQRRRISGLIKTKADLDRARQEINQLRAQADEYLAEVDRLKEENIALREDTSTLRTSLSQTTQEKQALTVAYEELEVEREELRGKVDIASAIKAKNINVTGYKIKNSGRLKEKDKAGKVDQLKVCFETVPNQVVEPGMEQFFVRIVDPLGETLAVEAMGSGVLTNIATGEQVRYTKYVENDYNNGEVQLCTQWKSDTDFPEGQYQVEIYNKGYLVGQGAFTLD